MSRPLTHETAPAVAGRVCENGHTLCVLCIEQGYCGECGSVFL
jgi:hypothetical protein